MSIPVVSPTAPFHVGIATVEPENVQSALTALLGLKWVALPRPPVQHYSPDGPVQPAPRVSYSADGPLHIEVLESAPGTIYDWKAGTYLHHIGYWSSHLATDLSQAESQHWTIEASMRDENGHPAIFAYLTKPGEKRIELCDESGRAAFEELMRSGLLDRPDR